MMFKYDMVSVIKVDGKILREEGNVVKIPFGSEYSIMVKNLKSRKARVKIFIDGEDVLDGGGLIVNGNDTIELERYFNKAYKFRFIQKTEKIQEHRGDKIDDGIIRIEFQYEKVIPTYVLTNNNGWGSGYAPQPWATNCNVYNQSPTTYNSFDTKITGSLSGSAHMDSLDATTYSVKAMKLGNVNKNNTTVSSMAIRNTLPKQDEGITVAGSDSSQKFTKGYIGELESEKNVITLKLEGYTESGDTVKKAVTVKMKKRCKICGTINSSKNKFCGECAARLE